MSGTAYTHGYAESVLDSHRGRTAQNSAAHLLPHLRPGSTLLDVGSGAGTITADLATLVAPGWVTALEMSTEALDLTRAELDRQGRSGVDLVVGDVHSLDFASDSFDVVHAHQVLQHVTDPVAALREMIRVCRPGRASAPGAPTGAASGERGGGIGLVAARDADYGAFSWYPELPGLTRWRELYSAAARANGGEPDAGRRLLAWAHAAGATEVTVSTSTWCYAEPATRQTWGSMWAQRITSSAVAEQLVTTGLASPAELADIADAWQAWAAHPDGWISILHGEIIIRL